jgi:ABC-type cobalamin/Fe3+-siderophores transport system ATPase subunit
MPYVGIGGTVTLKAKTVNAAKQPTDASALQLVITDPAGAPLAGFPLSIGSFVRTALGRYADGGWFQTPSMRQISSLRESLDTMNTRTNRNLPRQ